MTVDYLDLPTQFTGFLSFIGTIFVFLFIILIISKARLHKDRVLYAFALFVMGLNAPWYPSGFCYIYWLITKNVFTYEVYMILGNFSTPIVTLSWFYIYTNLIARNHKKSILISLGILYLVFYILLFSFIFIPNLPREDLIGILILNNPFDSEYRGFVLIYMIISFVISDATIFHFCYISIKKSESKKTRWNGFFFLLATILYAIGAIIDGIVILNIIDLIIVRTILLFAGISFYLGLIMPEWFKKFLKISDES